MDPSTIPDAKMQALLDAEAANLRTNLNRIGGTVSLVHDLDALYEALATSVVIPDGGVVTTPAKAILVTLHLLMRARNDLIQGFINLLRGYRGNSLRFLRSAIEACAFAGRIQRSPERADFWLNAASSDDAYKKFRKKFDPLFPKEPDLELRALIQRYVFCSRVIHTSIYSVSGHATHVDHGTGPMIRFNAFDLSDDETAIGSSLYATLDAHRLILRKFADVLAANTVDGLRAWEGRYSATQERFDRDRERWKALRPNPLDPKT